MLADKPAEVVATTMDHVCKYWLCADSKGQRGQTGERLAERLKTALPNAQISAFGPLDDAIRAALSMVEEHETILVFGSFLTVSAAADILKNSLQHDGHDADRITSDESGKNPREKTNG